MKGNGRTCPSYIAKAKTSGFLNVEGHLFNEQGPEWMLRSSEGELNTEQLKVHVHECSKLVCIPVVKCEVLGPQLSLLLMRVTWERCKDFAGFF